MLEFIGAYGKITKDSVAGPSGSPLNPRYWQQQLVGSTFARDLYTGRRLHRTALWGMARKNGKTGLIAPIAVHGLVLEGEGAEVYSCAADQDQAKLVFTAAKRTVEMDPELSGILKLYRDVIEYPATGSIYRALSSEAFTKEGLSPTLVLSDELHAWPNRELYDVMALAMGARLDPLHLIVTTAGVRTDTTGQDSIAYTLYQYGKRVVTGEVQDTSFFMAWWEAQPGPVTDEQGWTDANPGLGDILDRSELAGQANRALVGGMAESEFRIKRRNEWVVSSVAALPSGLFENLAEPDRDLPKATRWVLFFDGSFNHDCTALLAVSIDPKPHLRVVDCWERPLTEPQWRVPIDKVDEAVRLAVKDYKAVELACDPFRWQQAMEQWAADGLPVVEYPTSSPSRMVPAWATFYDATLEGRYTHDGDPRLVRQVGNMTLKTDRLGPRPVKEHRGSPRSIDLGICAVGGLDRALSLQTIPVDGPSVYNRRGVDFV